MHIYDPNGLIRLRRKQQERRETLRVIVFSMGAVAVMLLLLVFGLAVYR
jgi:archaellum biogenesis protein FlaJ (TadC family)